MENSIVNSKEIKRKGKKDIVYCRMDKVMIQQLFELREASGVSTSEILRESVRRLLEETKLTGLNLTI